jgi:hypothetical protein
MAASEAMIERLRRMTGEVDGDYEDETLAETIERYPMLDADGLGPDSDDWAARYDLNAAAADIWAEKEAQAMATVGTASTGSVKSITDQGTSITYADAGSTATATYAGTMKDYYRRRIVPRFI